MADDDNVVTLAAVLERRAGIPSLEAIADAAVERGDIEALMDADAAIMLAEMEIGERNPAYRRHKARERGNRIAEHYLRELEEAALRHADEL